MTRSRASAKAAGSRFERSIADYLNEHVDDRIDRRVKTGAKDKGDIAGVRIHGERVVLEVKDYGGRINAAEFYTEADIERGNDDAIAGLAVVKRRGTADPGDQWVLGTVRDLVALITGQRPQEKS